MRKNNQYLLAYNSKKIDVWYQDFRVDLLDADAKLRELLTAGYIIYDAPASGDLDLSGLAPGNYIILWKTNALTGDVNFSEAKTLTGTTGLHTKVILMGIKLNATTNLITEIYNNSLLNLVIGADVDCANFEIWYCDTELKFSGSYDLTNFNCYYSLLKMVGTFTTIDIYINNSINCKWSATSYIQNLYFKNTIENNIFQDSSSGTLFFYVTDNNTLKFVNCLFYKESSDATATTFKYEESDYNIIDFDNCFFYNLNITTSETIPSDQKYGILYINRAVNIINTNYRVIKRAYKFGSNFIMRDTLALSTLATATNYNRIRCDTSINYVTEIGLYGSISKRFYQVNFLDTGIVDDDVKYFDFDDLMIVQRDDLETTLITAQKYIKNFILYSNSGATTEATYRNDENFLIIAQDSDSNYVCFGFVNNMLYRTVFSNIFDDKIYTIVRVIQIYQPSLEISGLSQKWALTDWGMSGSVTYDNLDNEVIVR